MVHISNIFMIAKNSKKWQRFEKNWIDVIRGLFDYQKSNEL